ncbi:uncharacterized protein [Argopecten irradians]|uniref:uncharacterized protein n=1 Tax=Argopecten irradians TaxID=31199 RepID=UPI00371861E0
MATTSELEASEVLKNVIEEKKNIQEMMTLQVLSCNSFGGCHFSNAFVTTQKKLSTFPKLSPCGEKANGLYFQHIWDIPKLAVLIQEKQREDGDIEDTPSTKRPKLLTVEEIKAYACLQRYLKDINIHQKSLEKVLGAAGCCQSDVVKVVGTHLFGPLSEGTCYIGDHLGNVCSCGCGKQLQDGPTGLGVEYTWHGTADLFVYETIPVAVWSDLEDPDPDIVRPDPEGRDKDYEKYLQKIELSVQVKKDQAYSQIMAQTITNGFAQTNKNELLAGIPVPTFGCTPSKIMFYAYDCKSDILLQRLFGVDFVGTHSLSKAAVLVWLYLNFTLFMKKDVTNIETHPELKNFQANFCSDELIRSSYNHVKAGVKVTAFQNSSKNETHVELVTTREIQID